MSDTSKYEINWLEITEILNAVYHDEAKKTFKSKDMLSVFNETGITTILYSKGEVEEPKVIEGMGDCEKFFLNTQALLTDKLQGMLMEDYKLPAKKARRYSSGKLPEAKVVNNRCSNNWAVCKKNKREFRSYLCC